MVSGIRARKRACCVRGETLASVSSRNAPPNSDTPCCRMRRDTSIPVISNIYIHLTLQRQYERQTHLRWDQAVVQGTTTTLKSHTMRQHSYMHLLYDVPHSHAILYSLPHLQHASSPGTATPLLEHSQQRTMPRLDQVRGRGRHVRVLRGTLHLLLQEQESVLQLQR